MTTLTTGPADLWRQRLERFEALRILYEADDRWGPLYVAVSGQAEARDFARAARTKEEADERRKEVEHADEIEEREMRRHIAEIWTPMIEAGLALIHTPAPDHAALRIKHELLSEGIGIIDYEDEAKLFAILQEDVRRLLAAGGLGRGDPPPSQ